jgi:glucokinase
MPDFALAADIGGTKIAAARVSESGKITHLNTCATPAHGGYDVVQALIALLQNLPQKNARVLAVDVPGLAYRDGHVWAPNIKGWKHMPLARALRKHFQLPVLIESDRNAFVVGEAWRGAARNRKDVVFVVVGTGIGAGILSGGRLVRGAAELAGAIGWMAVRDEYLPQYKSVGCLEAHAAGPGISKAAAVKMRRNLSAVELTTLARQGDKAARDVLHEAGSYLGLALANLVSTLNPKVIVVGGGVAEAGDLVLNPARETMKRWAQPLAAKQVRIVPSRLGIKAGLLGVAKLGFESCRAKYSEL